ncbi:class I SAM-dependent methyltransferase [Dactylosporangium sp. NBC_01737]|uniref:class I SAM-dependent methyltransferase n=1 Tax=Dactylosporangium sp. NBC_01737 TaxID=2975959 RepID=UPI002E104E13|nr:class I SAM-dependent methyltransferase [Dactylosporangium sp. NBC_01737]
MNQTARWSGIAGQAWIDAQAMLDELFRPFEDLLVAEVAAAGAGRVLDVGCGTGSTTVAVARRLGTGGCAGVDIAEPMLAAARARADRDGVPVAFIHADAQEHDFTPGGFDAVISRFGVMFFTDPVRAFANLRRAATTGAILRAVVWRDIAQNPFMTTAERAAAPLVPDLPVRRPGEPGQFAFADPDLVRGILDRGGWTGVGIRPVDVRCVLPERDLVHYFTRLGPLGIVLGQADEQTRARVVDTVRAAFDPYVHGEEVRFTAACWQVDASAAR